MQQEILRQAGADGNGTKKAWAFGIGLERIAMPLFKIPDIRIFWSANKRFLGGAPPLAGWPGRGGQQAFCSWANEQVKAFRVDSHNAAEIRMLRRLHLNF